MALSLRRRRLLLRLLLQKKKLLLLLLLLHAARNRAGQRRYWVHPINQRRQTHGVYANLVQELRADPDQRRHLQYLRMTAANFDHLLGLMARRLTKKDTHFRRAIEPGLKLAVTLHHLAEGASHASIASHYRLGRSTASLIIYETCRALWDVLQPIYVKAPAGPAEWRAVAEGFEKWNFPHCLGSVDGKHIQIQKPKGSGSVYTNYKQRDSIVLMAICDASYRFTMLDIGQVGGQSDGGVWEASAFGSALLNDRVNLPEPENLPGGPLVPYVFVADEAFPLKPYMMRPFPGRSLDSDEKRIFNYRLSRARRVIENAFGIMAHRWRLLLKMMVAEPKKAVLLVKAMCALHNFLRTVGDPSYTPAGFADSVAPGGQVNEGFWRTNTHGNIGTDTNRTNRSMTAAASAIRDRYKNYFNTEEGSVPWQMAHIHQR